MKSKFSGWAYFITFYASLFTLILLFCIVSDIAYNNILPAYFYFIITCCVIFVWCWVVLGELRNKVVSIEIGYDNIIIKRYLGLGPAKTIYFDQLDGFKTSILPSRANLYEFLYLMAGDKKVVKLSQYYHRNYTDLKEALISANIKDLGFEDYSAMRELKEIFI